MTETGTSDQSFQAGPFFTMLAVVVAICLLAVGWVFAMTQDLTVLLFGAFAVLGVAALAITVLVVVWVYHDAKRIGVPVVPWTLVVLLLGVLGLAFYLVMRELRPGQQHDPSL